MAASLGGIKRWSGRIDSTGHRIYTLVVRIFTSDINDGPYTVMNTPGLPQVGDLWHFGNDVDSWVWCTPKCSATPMANEESNTEWELEMEFSNLPMNRCFFDPISDPTDEPPKASGSFVTYTRQALYDMNGDALINSAYQFIKEFFPQEVEKDEARPTVTIEQNIATLPLMTYVQMIHTLNDDYLWGLPARSIKLSRITWSRKLYGICTYYYTQGLDFDIRIPDPNDPYATGAGGFDRVVPDRGSKVLYPGGTVGNFPDYKYFYDPTTNDKDIINLNGRGQQALNQSQLYYNTIKLYAESNFLLLGVPITF